MKFPPQSIVALILLSVQCLSFAVTRTPEETQAAMRALQWQNGPGTGAVADKATIKLNEGLSFLDESNSNKFLELTGNLPSPGYNILATNDWFAAFSFNSSGYVKDDEKIDADALLKQIQESDGPANVERRKLGFPELFTDGWYVPPHYDVATKRLEWGLRLRTNNGPTINYTVRILGRTGYQSAVLVSSPERLDADVRAFKVALQGFNFNTGERYSEFKQGDRVAEFGLAALVAGGAAAVAVKTGLWKGLAVFFAAFWKLILGAGIAVLAGLGKLFFKGRKTD